MVHKVINYVLFALLATAINIALQGLSFIFYDGPSAIYIAMLWGTAGGLLVKYFLDKIYIFEHKTSSRKDDLKTFVLYSLMGVVTTVIFWGTELLFDALFHRFESAKYFGAAIGLTIGYVSKYFLDRRFVFRT